MKTMYTVKSVLTINAADAKYFITFGVEFLYGKAWEFDPNSDAIGQYKRHDTGKVRISVAPVVNTMAFPEDADRQMSYLIDIEAARKIWLMAKHDTPNMWYFLDMCSYFSKNHTIDNTTLKRRPANGVLTEEEMAVVQARVNKMKLAHR